MTSEEKIIIIVNDVTASSLHELEQMAEAMQEIVLANPYKLECEVLPDEIREEVCSVFLIHYQSHISTKHTGLVRIRSPDRLNTLLF